MTKPSSPNRSGQLSAIAATWLVLCCAGAQAADIFVSPNGNDKWSGRLPAANADKTDGPLATLGRACRLVAPADTCFVRKGVYREVLKPARSGKPGAPITFRSYKNERAVISGADRVTGWKRLGTGLYAAGIAWDLKEQNQLFCDGKILTEARWPDIGGTVLKPVRARVQSGTLNTITDPKLTGPDDAWKGALLWCAGGAEWICWTARVTAYDARTHTLTFKTEQTKRRWYVPRKGNPYVLMGAKRALDSPGEWLMDASSKTLHLRPPLGKDPNTLAIGVKRRLDAIDLSGRSHIRVIGLEFRAAGVRTDNASSDILLKGLRGAWVAHSYENDTTGKSGVLVHGSRIELADCEFSYSSGSVVDVRGRDNRVVNSYIHSGNYGAKWRGTLAVTGRRHVIAHNTIRHSGRDLVNIHGLSESLIEYNELSDAGWLTSDLGMIYGHNTDFGNTEIRYNLVHDNHAPSCNMGIYFDHLSHNVIVHHNAVWNVRQDPIRINNPSYCGLVYHNSCWNTGRIVTFDHSRRNDLFATRYNNNIINAPFRLPKHVATTHNIISKTPPLVDTAKRNFALKPDSKARNAGLAIMGMSSPDKKPDIGALEFGAKPWKAGHDFSRTTPVNSKLTPAMIGGMNLVKNACFELPTLEAWTPIGAKKAKLTKGNGWGNAVYGSAKACPTGTSKFQLRLGAGRDGVTQTVTGLLPNTQYSLSAWLKVSAAKESLTLSAANFGRKDISASTSSTTWVRKTVSFRTGPQARTATVTLQKTTDTPGHAWCDNITLPQIMNLTKESPAKGPALHSSKSDAGAAAARTRRIEFPTSH